MGAIVNRAYQVLVYCCSNASLFSGPVSGAGSPDILYPFGNDILMYSGDTELFTRQGPNPGRS
jgi:hypothetical protein